MIAAWRSDLDRILHVFEVRSVVNSLHREFYTIDDRAKMPKHAKLGRHNTRPPAPRFILSTLSMQQIKHN